MLAPRVPTDFAAASEAHFRGMTAEPVEAQVLLNIHERLLAHVAGWRCLRQKSPFRAASSRIKKRAAARRARKVGDRLPVAGQLPFDATVLAAPAQSF